MVDRRNKAGHMELTAPERAEVRRIAKEIAALAATGHVLPGSIAERLTRCGRANCACHADPPKRHGPYWHWTRKVANKTVGRWLNSEQAEDYLPWVHNDRRIRELLARLEEIAVAHLDADRR